MKRPLLVFLLLGFSFVINEAPLFAQTTGLNGFDLRLFRPPAGPGGVLNLHGSKTLEPWQFSLGTINETSHNLLTATNPTTGQTLRVVDDFIISNFTAAVGLTDFLQAGLVIPTVLFEQGTNFNTGAAFQTASFGDIALEVKLRALRDEGAWPGVSVISTTTFPSGNTGKFTGEPNVTEEVRLALDKTIGPVYLALNGGYRILERTAVVNLVMNDLVVYGAGLAWTLPFANGGLDLIGEVDGSFVAGDAREITSPLEWLVGVRQRVLEGVSYEIAGGRGVTDSVAGGDWRIVAGLRFTTPSRASRSPEEMETLRKEVLLFRFNKSRIRPPDEATLDRVAEWSREDKKTKFRIRGHADDSGGASRQQELSRRRAEAVRDALVQRGVSPGRILIESAGSSEPVSSGRNRSARAQNRRVEIWEVK